MEALRGLVGLPFGILEQDKVGILLGLLCLRFGEFGRGIRVSRLVLETGIRVGLLLGEFFRLFEFELGFEFDCVGVLVGLFLDGLILVGVLTGLVFVGLVLVGGLFRTFFVGEDPPLFVDLKVGILEV